jgi:hypothetical protein
MHEVGEQTKTYIVEDLMNKLTEYFTAVDAFMQRYVSSLRQSQVDASRNEAERRATADALAAIKSDVDDHLTSLATLKDRVGGSL